VQMIKAHQTNICTIVRIGVVPLAYDPRGWWLNFGPCAQVSGPSLWTATINGGMLTRLKNR